MEQAALDTRAHVAVRKAVKDGDMVNPMMCSECGKECKAVAHHHNGYDKKHWLDVQWLCAKCHVSKHPHDRHLIADHERGHRKPIDPNGTARYTIRIRQETHAALLKAGTKRVRALLDEFADAA